MNDIIYLYGQRYRIIMLPAGIVSPTTKQKLAYQHGVDITGKYVDLCGKFSISKDTYVLEKTKTVKYNDYSIDELKIILHLLKVSLITTNTRFIEILIRGLRDKDLLSYFYDDISLDSSKLIAKVNELIHDPNKICICSDLRPARFDRHKYSIYQLLKDLKTYKAEICINKDILNYSEITTSNRDLLNTTTTVFGKICKVIGNRERANLSLLLKLEEDYITLCFVRDGKPHLTNFILKVDNPYLRRKLYGARVVVDPIFKNILSIDTSRLPVISRRFLRVTEEDLVTYLIEEELQKICMSKVITPEKTKSDKKNSVTVKDKYSYCELKVKLLGSKSLKDLIKDESLDYKDCKKRLKRSREVYNDTVFRYLLKKIHSSGTFSGRYKDIKGQIRIKTNDKNR